MGLRQKKRRLRLRVPEGIALALVSLTCLSGFFWWSDGVDPHWKTAAVTIKEFRLQKDSGADIMSPRLEVLFTYTVDGVEHVGIHYLGWIERIFFGPIPEDARSELKARGFHRFSDLPDPIQGVLQKKGIGSFEEVPQPLLNELKEAGMPDKEDVPEELHDAVRNKEYDKLAAAIDLALPDYSSYWMASAEATRTGGEAGVTVAYNPVLDALRSRFRLSVAYDPLNPGNYRVTTLRRWGNGMSLMLFFGGTLGVVLYMAYGYPRLKRYF